MTKQIPSPVIFGCSGAVLTPEERAFFIAHQPTGFILFKRNIDTPTQVKALVADLKATLSHGNPCVLIDQEGGRVARLGPPHWPHRPSMGELAQANDPEKAVYDHFTAIAHDLKTLGITVNCAPVLDLDVEGAHQGVMGDRTFSKDPKVVTTLGRIAIQAHLDNGILPIIKHIPGHGAARYDSHEKLPSIDLSLKDLAPHFIPFQENVLSGAWGMTSHCLYPAIDPDHPLTQSAKGIRFIREIIGFKGTLLTDDINMHALSGSFKERTETSLAAGCNIVVHCSGQMEEMEDVMRGVERLRGGGVGT